MPSEVNETISEIQTAAAEAEYIFSERLQRRFNAMACNPALCTCGKPSGHLPPCPGYYWENAAAIVRDAFEGR